jgi:hypothetical protein
MANETASNRFEEEKSEIISLLQEDNTYPDISACLFVGLSSSEGSYAKLVADPDREPTHLGIAEMPAMLAFALQAAARNSGESVRRTAARAIAVSDELDSRLGGFESTDD